MRTKGWVLGSVFVAAVAVSGCARTDDPTPHGGETNWLRSCKGDVDCASGSCVCGLCSTACGADGDCAGDFEGSCVSADSRIGASVCNSTKGWVPALCLPVCSGDQACGAGFLCREGACVTLEHAFEFDTTVMAADSGPPRVADAGVVPIPDAGLPPVVPSDAGLESDAEAASCTLAQPDCNPAETFICKWETMSTHLPVCYVPFQSEFFAVRCGAYDGVVAQGIDSRSTFFYDAQGELVARNDQGIGSTGCTAYDASFRLEPCEVVTPECPDPDAPCDCEAEAQSLACVCSVAKCQPFVVATNLELSCQAGNPNPSLIARGCGLTRVSRPAGLGSLVFVYDDSETLTGAAITDDTPLGECGRSSYRTAMPDLEKCDDYSVCSPCDSTEYEKCQP